MVKSQKSNTKEESHMKKTASLFFFITCLTLVFSVSAFAESSSTLLTDNVATMGSHSSGMSLANSNNSYGTNNTGTSSNNYRTYATTDNNNSNWGWLGLLGLAGLAGLRSRNRERT
jgi:MYXO-CTERM domain-containing protein